MSVVNYGASSTADGLFMRTQHRNEERARKGLQRVPHSFSQDGLVRDSFNLVIRNAGTGAALANDLWTDVDSPGNAYVFAEVQDPREGALARSTFCVSKVKSKNGGGLGIPRRQYDRESENLIRYGEPFQLVCNPSLLLDERSNMLGANFYLKADRSMYGQGNIVSMTRDGSDCRTHFVAVPAGGEAALIQTRGVPVPANRALCLKHVMSNQILGAVDNSNGLSLPTKEPASEESEESKSREEDEENPTRGTAQRQGLLIKRASSKDMGKGACSAVSNNHNSNRARIGTILRVECSQSIRSVGSDKQPLLLWEFATSIDAQDAVDWRNLPKRITKPQELLAKIRSVLCNRNGGANHHGIREISREFRLIDIDKSGTLEHSEILVGLEKFGISLDKEQVSMLFEFLDSDKNGTVDLNEFLAAIRGPLKKRRIKMILMAYDVLDLDQNGTVTLEELAAHYDTSFHPDVIDGKKTHLEAVKDFIAQWDNGGEDGKGAGDGIITKDEFIHYYRDVSASIDDDDYFELMIRNAWHISGGQGWCENTSNIRVLVTHSDDSAEVVELRNDFGVSRQDMPAIRAVLRKQGVQDIKRVSLAD